MQLRHLHYFVTLAEERHFRRAAELCHVTQSTLSAAVRQLEEEVGAPLIERDKRFREVTAEGRALLVWARRILAEQRSLHQELDLLRQGLAGDLRLGVVPAALPTIALLTTPFNHRHAGVRLRVLSRSSKEIQRALDDFALDAGVTYLDNEPLHGVREIPLYEERYILLTPAEGPFADHDGVTWAEAATAPLCLLTPDMQNRRIIDGIFGAVGQTPRVLVETNSVMTLCSHIRTGAWSSVFPHNFLWVFGTPPGMRALPLVEPVQKHVVGLVVSDRAPVSPLIRALEAVALEADITGQLAPLVRQGAV
ncbi:MAG: LysR family transcriptional regulator [Alphaproteobacteria bacterium]|nr:LysR family transcriptional regulator [Alphaproteobacteria bacterium]